MIGADSVSGLVRAEQGTDVDPEYEEPDPKPDDVPVKWREELVDPEDVESLFDLIVTPADAECDFFICDLK